MTYDFGFCNSVFKSLFLVVCFSCVICSSSPAEGNEKIHFSAHPVIGRLFKADAVRSRVGLTTPHNPKSFKSEKDRPHDSATNEELALKKDLHRESRSKNVVLGGVKYEVDSQDKIKKHGYEATKKPIKRNNQPVRRRVRRSENQHGTTLKGMNSERGFEASLNNTNNVDESSMKRSYAQKAFKRRIEALFTEKGPSGLSEEEVNKTKNLRKQLLNIYVRGKQNKYYTHSNTTSLFRSDLNDEDNKSERQILRVKIDIPIENPNDLDWIREIKDVNDNNITKGQSRTGRRRIRKVIIPLLLALKLKTALVIPLLFGAVSLIAFKGLWAGMTALAMVSALALKSLMHGKSSVTYEVRAPPPHYHMPHHVHHDYGYHHGYLHPEYHWSRNDDDSYKPQGGWRDGEASDTWLDSSSETSYSTINPDVQISEQDKQLPKTTNCSSSNSSPDKI
ncbi:uncharacterized protein LOC111063771 [Nilaparvata lugens]|uniref:uncharacterized protein LOC111063771 n=1 Tax=Nilaparvata lugens TaxID=108931 RepID=UPI00193E83FA|nr:uncharacterized protein LOC111063771 [Nilaparvata lugens]